MASDGVKAQVRQTYQVTASAYGSRSVAVVARRLLELAQVQPGEVVLEVATGTGLVALEAAALVGSRGSVIGLDLTPEMLAIGRRRAGELRLSNVEFHEGDAEALPFPDAAFDAVLCGCGIFFLPDQAAALREWRCCLKPEGRVVFSTWARGNNGPLNEINRKWQAEYGLQVFDSPTPLFGPGTIPPAVDGGGLRRCPGG